MIYIVYCWTESNYDFDGNYDTGIEFVGAFRTEEEAKKFCRLHKDYSYEEVKIIS